MEKTISINKQLADHGNKVNYNKVGNSSNNIENQDIILSKMDIKQLSLKKSYCIL